jgi:hypothetical protein
LRNASPRIIFSDGKTWSSNITVTRPKSAKKRERIASSKFAIWFWGAYDVRLVSLSDAAFAPAHLQRDDGRVRARLELGLVVESLLALLVERLQVADRRRLGQEVRVLVLEVRNQHAELRSKCRITGGVQNMSVETIC